MLVSRQRTLAGRGIPLTDLQPGGYERANPPRKLGNYRHFRAASLTNVRVWLRRSIGQSLAAHKVKLGDERHKVEVAEGVSANWSSYIFY